MDGDFIRKIGEMGFLEIPSHPIYELKEAYKSIHKGFPVAEVLEVFILNQNDKAYARCAYVEPGWEHIPHIWIMAVEDLEKHYDLKSGGTHGWRLHKKSEINR